MYFIWVLLFPIACCVLMTFFATVPVLHWSGLESLGSDYTW